MSTYTCFECDLCKITINKEKDLDRSDLTTGRLSFWLHNERKGYVNTDGKHYETCPKCTEIIMKAVEAIKND